MAAGVADHVWTLEEIVRLLDPAPKAEPTAEPERIVAEAN